MQNTYSVLPLCVNKGENENMFSFACIFFKKHSELVKVVTCGENGLGRNRSRGQTYWYIFFMSLQFSNHLDCIFIQNLKN